VAKGKLRNPERERQWRRHLRRQRRSGLTVREYCGQEQLPESTFHFWRREIAARDQQRQSQPAMSATPTFVPVTVVATPRPTAIDIRLSSGHRLRVRAGCDLPLLTQVVALLEGRSC
jgi:hypothetical protein